MRTPPKSEVFLADCMEIMSRYPDNYFELAIIDPPYGIGENGSSNHTRGKLADARVYKPFAGLDKEPPSQEYFDEILRVSKNQIVFGANHFISRLPYDSSCWIVWDKDNGTTDFADCELAWTSFKTAVRRFRWRWQGMLQQNMKNKDQRIHPTQKPIDLYLWLLTNYAKQGDKILDTHLGSGSSRIAAHRLGFDFVGCEIDKDYFDAAQLRFERETRQSQMF